jgi:hypothetical protein
MEENPANAQASVRETVQSVSELQIAWNNPGTAKQSSNILMLSPLSTSALLSVLLTGRNGSFTSFSDVLDTRDS